MVLLFFQTTSSVNVLGALYCQLPMVRKNTVFGKLLTKNTLGKRQVK